jgi:hypothetical protein
MLMKAGLVKSIYMELRLSSAAEGTFLVSYLVRLSLLSRTEYRQSAYYQRFNVLRPTQCMVFTPEIPDHTLTKPERGLSIDDRILLLDKRFDLLHKRFILFHQPFLLP